MRISVRAPLFGALLALAASASACSPINTVPAPVTPADPVQYYDLDLPSSLEIKSVAFDAALFTDVSGGPDAVGSQVGGRGFLKVYAVDRKTGEQYLLIYENIRERKRPVQIIRFRAVPDDTLLGPHPAP
jgi:hypothetical protein